ncbi:RimK family alpha-L-glutamate ligase [Streptomyces tricolor]|nr:RimK family alpha-L-glutamate ligase [Streptomyces tricolor]
MTNRVAVVADRVGWEERRLIETAQDFGLRFDWVNDESLCAGHRDALSVKDYDALMVRSRSYTRGRPDRHPRRGGRLPRPQLRRRDPLPARTSWCCAPCCARPASRVPEFGLALSRKDFEKALGELGVPVVLKPVYGGMGKRVTLVRDPDPGALRLRLRRGPGPRLRAGLPGGAPTSAAGRSAAWSSAGRSSPPPSSRARAPTGAATRPWATRAGRWAHDPDVQKIVDGVVDRPRQRHLRGRPVQDPVGLSRQRGQPRPRLAGVASTTGVDIASVVVRYVQETLE